MKPVHLRSWLPAISFAMAIHLVIIGVFLYPNLNIPPSISAAKPTNTLNQILPDLPISKPDLNNLRAEATENDNSIHMNIAELPIETNFTEHDFTPKLTAHFITANALANSRQKNERDIAGLSPISTTISSAADIAKNTDLAENRLSKLIPTKQSENNSINNVDSALNSHIHSTLSQPIHDTSESIQIQSKTVPLTYQNVDSNTANPIDKVLTSRDVPQQRISQQNSLVKEDVNIIQQTQVINNKLSALIAGVRQRNEQKIKAGQLYEQHALQQRQNTINHPQESALVAEQ